jgi:hypothetical protein
VVWAWGSELEDRLSGGLLGRFWHAIRGCDGRDVLLGRMLCKLRLCLSSCKPDRTAQACTINVAKGNLLSQFDTLCREIGFITTFMLCCHFRRISRIDLMARIWYFSRETIIYVAIMTLRQIDAATENGNGESQ